MPALLRGPRWLRWLAPTALLGSALLAFAGCTSSPEDPLTRVHDRRDRLTELVDERIEDPAKAAQIKVVLNQTVERFDIQYELIKDWQVDLQDAARRYETTDAELEEILAGILGDSLELRKILQDGHFEIEALVTAEEWLALLDA